MVSAIEAEYRRRLAGYQGELAAALGRSQGLLFGVLAAALLLVAAVAKLVYGWAPVWWVAVAAVALVVVVPLWGRAREATLRALRLVELYDKAMGRLDGTAVQSGATGEAYAEAGHLYSRDLDVLGLESLFGMMPGTRTALGQRALAGMLLRPVSAGEVRARQAGVRELAPRIDLRERMALLGWKTSEGAPAERFAVWVGGEHGAFAGWMRWVLLGLTAAWIVVIGVAALRHGDMGDALRNAAAMGAVQGAFCLWLRPRVVAELEAATKLAAETAVLREGLRLMRSEKFEAGLLVGLQEMRPVAAAEATPPCRDEAAPRVGHPAAAEATPPCRDETASRVGHPAGARVGHPAGVGVGQPGAVGSSEIDAEVALARLARSLTLVEQRAKEWYYAPAIMLAVGTHAAISLSQWRAEYGHLLLAWVAAWGEFEALVALGAYAAEHAENVYPEVVDGAAAMLVAEGLQHPLLPRDVAVANDVRLDAETRFLLVSGSNMAGKSTLLRAVGANVVLALAGLPVGARGMRLSALRVGASLALSDSLAEGKSKFLAEVERLRDVLALARGEGLSVRAEGSELRAKSLGGGCLFLIDEIFSGTNSADRRAAAEAVLRGLITAGAVGALSTHDLLLAELAEMPELGGRNVHMASPVEDDPLAFDYLLKDGVNRTTNALAIVRMLGLGG